MAFDFPANPTVGLTYSVAGITYAWDGVAWNVVASGGYAPKTAQARNRITNPVIMVSQEYGTASVSTNGLYPADQWQFMLVALTTVSAQSIGGVTSPEGTTSSLVTSITTGKPSLAAGDYWAIRQQIEGTQVADFQWGTAAAKNAVLRFNFWSTQAGTYCVAVRNPSGARSFIATFTQPAAAWARQSIVIPGDTTGTWAKDNTSGIDMWFTFAAGTTYQAPAVGWNAGNYLNLTGTTNGAAVSANGFYVTDIGLYLDPDKTGLPPPWERPNFTEELMRCRRYFAQRSQVIVNPNVSNMSTYYGPAMRTPPTIAGSPAISTGAVTGEDADIYAARAYTTLVFNARM